MVLNSNTAVFFIYERRWPPISVGCIVALTVLSLWWCVDIFIICKLLLGITFRSNILLPINHRNMDVLPPITYPSLLRPPSRRFTLFAASLIIRFLQLFIIVNDQLIKFLLEYVVFTSSRWVLFKCCFYVQWRACIVKFFQYRTRGIQGFYNVSVPFIKSPRTFLLNR